MAAMEMDSVECVSSIDGVEDEEMQLAVSHNTQHAHPHQYSSKPHGVIASGLVPSSVHELLECPVCTNSMYPPIHQVCSMSLFQFISFFSFSDALH